jgi:asparagine synthase (glutamine-hydrolysing)
MCGIAGCIALDAGLAPPTLTTLRRMAGALYHRGPDEQGIYRDARVGLAHARLSIIDLASGQQPMRSADGEGVIVFNGEIFNYVELRQELEQAGHRFATKSDTEVVLAAWLVWGEAGLDKLNGQWAFAVWEPERQRMVLARDRVGVRPLHLARHGGRLWFASEVKAIFAGAPDMPRELDPVGLDETFTFWSSLAPRTPFRGVEELEPGGLLVVDLRDGTELRRRWWSPSYPSERSQGFTGSLDDAVEEVRATLADATRLRMVRADVPVGSYLSGGLDSSIVAALGVHHQGETFHTFSLRFEDAEYDETEFQRAMVKRIGSQHHEVVVSRADIARAMPSVVFHTERPILRTAPAPLFYLSELVQQTGIKVVLTGEGADETFAGYDLFREGKVRRFWAKNPASKMRPMLLDRLYPYLQRSPVQQRAIAMQFFGRHLERATLPGFAHEPRWQAAAALKRLFSPEVHAATHDADPTVGLVASLPPDFSSWPALSQDQYLEVRTLLSGYILGSQGDRMLMAHAVEGRFPFLDARILELSARLPPSYKLRVLDEKHVLKRAARELVEPSIIARKKQPYRAPDALAFTGDSLPEQVAEALTPAAIERAAVFAPGPTEHLIQKIRRARGDAQFSNADNMAFVGVLTTQLLHQELCVRSPSPRDVTPRTVLDALGRDD